MEEETRRIIMTVEPATRKITKIEGENKETVEEVKAEDIEKTYQSENGFMKSVMMIVSKKMAGLWGFRHFNL